MLAMRLTKLECDRADEFARKIVGNIDNRDFMDSKNAWRSPKKLFDDSSKGKRAEIFIQNILKANNIFSTVDFDIYKKGVGDDGDVIVNGKSIDVKASSPRARCLMVEESRVNMWESVQKTPYCLCLVSVDGDDCTYKFGCSYSLFMEKANLLKRGDFIPNTGVPLKANNYVISIDKCKTDINDLIKFIERDGC